MWYVYITTAAGTFLLNYGGYTTKREAKRQAALALSLNETIAVKVVKEEHR